MIVLNPFLKDDLSSVPMVGRYETWRETVVSDGTAQGQATDFTANGNHLTQATTAAKPLYKTAILNGRPVWRFDGSNDYLMSASVPAMNNTNVRWYFIVAAYNASPAVNAVTFSGDDVSASPAGAGDLLICSTTGAIDNLRYINGGSPGYGDQNITQSGVGAFRMVSLIADGTNVRRRYGPAVYNASVAQVTPAVNGTFKLMMGAALNTGPALFCPADIACLFMGNTVLSATDILRIEAYLTRVYGVLP